MLVKTNELNILINYESLYTDYHVLIRELEYKNNWKKRQNEISEFKKNHLIEAYIIIAKKEILYLQDKKYPIEANSKHFESLENLEQYRTCNLILQLLNNKTSFFTLDEQDGGLYYVVQHKKKKNEVKQVITLSFQVDKTNCLETKVVTFSNLALDHYIKYKIVGKTIQLASNLKDDNLYIKKGNRYEKNIIGQFSASIKKFDSTKEYYRGILLRDIEQYLRRYLKVDFVQREMQCFKELKQSEKTKRNNVIDEIIVNGLKAVNIVDYTGKALEKIYNEIKEFNKNFIITSSDKVVKNKNNIVITEEKSYYQKKEIEDPYIKVKEADLYSQVLTIGNIKKVNVRVVLKELLIKQDIKNNLFSFTKEKQNAIKYVYIPRYDNKQLVNYIVMEMENERFTFRERNLFDRGFSSIESIFDRTTIKEVEAVIEDKYGNLNVIYKTSRYVIADSKFMLQYYKTYNTATDRSWNPRRKEFQSYMAGLYDIIYYKDNNACYYHVGYNKNYDFSSSKATPLRLVEAMEGELFIDTILSSLDEYIVKNKEVTVLPFYMKYAREYMNLKEQCR